MVRLSTLATSTLTSALKVLSTVLPDSMFFSLVRMTAPPLPGLWCWNQMTCQSWPSRLSTMPFFRSFVVAMRLLAPSRVGDLGCPWAQPPSLAVIRCAANSPTGQFWLAGVRRPANQYPQSAQYGQPKGPGRRLLAEDEAGGGDAGAGGDEDVLGVGDLVDGGAADLAGRL